MEDEIPEYQHKQARKLNYQERVKAGLQRGGLPKFSKKKEEWTKKYRKQKQEDQEYQICRICRKVEHKDNMEPHHPWGRSNENILKYWWIHTECHHKIHAKPNWARENRFLFF